MSIKVLKPGVQTTVQDIGRYGYSHFGISSSGPADEFSFRLGNIILGNDEKLASLEMTLYWEEIFNLIRILKLQ